MHSKILSAILGVLFLGSLVDASARRKVAIVGFGEDVKHIADNPTDPESPAFGLYYNSFRLFFVPVVTWGKQYVLYDADNYWELDQESLDAVKEDIGGVGMKALWARFVNWLWPTLLILYLIRRYIHKKQCEQIDEEFAHLR